MRRATVRITRHFAENLDSIEDFLREADAEGTFASLLDDLFERAIPALEEFPDIGSDFFAHLPSSREAASLAATLRDRLGAGTALRERVRGDYLILYSLRGNDLYLLGIEHHRQLSFDFPEHWEG